MAQIFNQVRLATSVNYVLTDALPIGTAEIDGVLVQVGDRVLVKAQTNKIENGIYEVGSNSKLARASDFATSSTPTASTIVFVQEGASLGDTGWILSSDGSLVVGTSELTFDLFSLNSKVVGANAASSIVYREAKGYPLTNLELDNNFRYLDLTAAAKLNIADFTPIAITDKINSLDAGTAALDAWQLQGKYPDITEEVDTIALRDGDGGLTATTFHGNLDGNADTATLADRATVANNVDGVVAVANGGTGATTPLDARNSLEVIGRSGDTMTGKLTLGAAGTAQLRIIPALALDTYENGDVWAIGSKIYYRLDGVNRTFASLESPNFTGAITAPTADIASDSTAVATTAYVQLHRRAIGQQIDLLAPKEAPLFSAAILNDEVVFPRSVTPNTDDGNSQGSNKIATTQYVVNRLNAGLAFYDTSLTVNDKITNALADYYTKTEVNSALNTNNDNYYTKTEIDNTFSNYSTSSQVSTAITNAVTSKAATTYVDNLQDKWGDSRKFVQSTAPTQAVDGDFWFKI